MTVSEADSTDIGMHAINVNQGGSLNKGRKKYLFVAGTTAAVGLTGLTGIGVAAAQSNPTTTSQNGSSSLVQKIADKFNLKTSDVQAVFDEEKAAHQAERKQKIEERLSQAVTEGTITADQKQKILDKLAEIESQMESNREAMKDKSAEERKAAMDAKKTELETWAKDNNIPDQFLRLLGGRGPGGPGGSHGEEATN